jgi:hypothetical protein
MNKIKAQKDHVACTDVIHCRTGKVKGIERLLGAVETLEQSLIEVTSGQAKYEHQHRAIVWRMNRLPKEGQGNCVVFC